MLQHLLFHRGRHGWTCSLIIILLCWFTFPVQSAEPLVAGDWVSVTDEKVVSRSGQWQVARFRFAAKDHLLTTAAGAAIEFQFQGTGLALRLGNHAVPAYGKPSLGQLRITVDDQQPTLITPQGTALEIIVARNLLAGNHQVKMVHQPAGMGTGCRIEAIRALKQPTGDLQFQVQGEENAFLVDVRAVLTRQNHTIRNTLARNWLNGHCQLVGLPPGDGYQLSVTAAGWQTVQSKPFRIHAGAVRQLPAIFLTRQDETRITSFRFPAMNQPAIRKPGMTFRARFLGFDTEIKTVTLTRRLGTATISRQVEFQEDRAAAFYYDREVSVQLPKDMPPGLYDLSVSVEGGRRTRVCKSPRSVFVVTEFPRNPVFVTFGHLDTSSQYQAEYLGRLANVINLLSPDLVLISNSVNPAYISGALSRLQVPYVINFGNHQFHGHEKWYGSPVGIIDYGPDLCILNFGRPWHVNRDQADAFLTARQQVSCKIINAFEHNAPVKTFLDKHRVNLIHDAHGIGTKVMEIGSTPTRRVGKINSESFRVIRFQGNRVTSCTYLDHETDPIPFAREAKQPLEVVYLGAVAEKGIVASAEVTNRLRESYPNCHVRFVLPRGDYQVVGGRLVSQVVADDGKHVVITAAVTLPAQQTVRLQIKAR